MEDYLILNDMDYPKTTWNGKDEFVYWEIVKWWSSDGTNPIEHWNSYVKIYKIDIPIILFDKIWLKAERQRIAKDCPWRINFNYYGNEILSNLPFHGGITFYERIYSETGKPYGIKIGCDYSHLYDEGHNYNQRFVKKELDKVIKSIKAITQTSIKTN